MKLQQTQDYLFLIDEKAEIKDKDYFIRDNPPINFKPKRFIKGRDVLSPTTKSLKIIGYSPLNSEAKELDLPLLPNPFEDDVEEEFKKFVWRTKHSSRFQKFTQDKAYKDGFIKGYKTAQSKQFSLEDMIHAYDTGTNDGAAFEHACEDHDSSEIIAEAMKYAELDREEFIQSLSTQRFPKEFIISDMEYLSTDGSWKNVRLPLLDDFARTANLRYKTITNSEGKQEIQGTYRY